MPGFYVSDVDANVVDMVDASGNWNFVEFDPLLPIELWLRIDATCPSKQRPTDFWAVIAKFRGLPKVRNFLWLVCHLRVLTNAEQLRRHMKNDGSCSLCGFPREDIDHVLRHCPVAISVRSQFEYFGRHESITQASLRLQNECVQSFGAIRSSNDALRRASRQGVRWQKPPKGWWKLNSDGATIFGSGLSSCSGVVRDEYGKWLIGFSQQISICSIVEAELWGVYEDLIRNYRSEVSTYSLVPYIVALLNRSWQVEIVNVLREGNQLANSMAKLDWLDDFIGHRFLAPPESVLQRLEEERGGMSFDAG
ncbi:hypothetical protein V6N12_076510 [Hibiscus sabdariffa]|uniref:Reverse transcriptase zinc-binding domain-containing protein n=1 Tax=Hibiscus sabdariffa TaxID=183260 RepID=A0ABR2DAW0_9ROSI